MKRRDFVTNTSALGLASTLAGPLVGLAAAGESNSQRNGIGLQLWTVRNQLADDVKGTLKAVADAGYKQVELMNVIDSVDLVKRAKDLGLEVRSAFFNWETIANPSNQDAPSIEKIIEVANEFGLEYLVFGYIGKSSRDTADKLKAITESANKAAEKISAAGMKMSYHNHSFEFEVLEEKKTGFEILMDGFDDKLINFELDVFWAAIGGWDPIKTMNRLGKRLGQIHLKDLKAGQGVIYDEGQVAHEAFQEVGDGTLNMKRIMRVADKHGVKQFHVEQDQSPDPLASIDQSIQYTRSIW